MRSHAKEEARQQLGKHLDTFWPKGMGKNQQETEKDTIIILLCFQEDAWHPALEQAPGSSS